MPHSPNDYEQRQPLRTPQYTNPASPSARANLIVLSAILLSLLVGGQTLNSSSLLHTGLVASARSAPASIDSQDTVSAVVSDGILKNGVDFATYTLPLQITPDKGATESSQTDGTGDHSSGPVIRWFHQVRVELDDGKPTLKLTLSAQIAKDASGNTVPNHAPVVIAKMLPQPLFGIPEQPPPHPDVQDLIRSEAVPKAQLGVTINGNHTDYATLAANTYNAIVTRDRLSLPLIGIQETIGNHAQPAKRL